MCADDTMTSYAGKPLIPGSSTEDNCAGFAANRSQLWLWVAAETGREGKGPGNCRDRDFMSP